MCDLIGLVVAVSVVIDVHVSNVAFVTGIGTVAGTFVVVVVAVYVVSIDDAKKIKYLRVLVHQKQSLKHHHHRYHLKLSTLPSHKLVD